MVGTDFFSKPNSTYIKTIKQSKSFFEMLKEIDTLRSDLYELQECNRELHNQNDRLYKRILELESEVKDEK